MGYAQDLVDAGYIGYRGWGDTEAAADFNATGGKGKEGGGMGGVAPFSFDYAAEAEKAYGELGAYYNRLITESRGDLNKILSRMVEDYDRGIRISKENQGLSEKGVVNSALSRGLYQKSAYAPSPEGFGIPDEQLAQARTPYERSREEANIELRRKQADLPEEQTRKEFDFEQRRREQAAEMSNLRGSQAYQRYSASLI